MRYYFLLLLLIASACAQPSLSLRKGSVYEPLNVYLDFKDPVPLSIREEFERQLDDAIVMHNSQFPKLMIERVYRPTNEKTVLVRIEGTRLVGPNQNAAGFIVSTVGLLIVPIVMVNSGADIILFFWYFPHTTSLVQMEMSNDINVPGQMPISFPLRSPGFLKSEPRQVAMHGITFNKLMRNQFKRMAQKALN